MSTADVLADAVREAILQAADPALLERLRNALQEYEHAQSVATARKEGEQALEMLRHAVGLDNVRRPSQAGYRRHYASGKGTPQERLWWLLVGMGLAVPNRYGALDETGDTQSFHVTDLGMKMLGVRAKP